MFILKYAMDTKQCSKCGKIKSINDFNIKKTTKDGYQYSCKECNKSYLKDHYSKNKEYNIQKTKKYKDDIKSFLDGYKKNLKCEKCSETDIACLDFHHLNCSEKDFEIGIAVSRGYSIDKIKQEIEKCVILCANCHRKLHYYE
jgi:hypothetical protein